MNQSICKPEKVSVSYFRLLLILSFCLLTMVSEASDVGFVDHRIDDDNAKYVVLVNAGDFDKDSDPDLYITRAIGTRMRWYENYTAQYTQSFLPHGIGSPGEAGFPRDSEVFDYDGDGDLDVIIWADNLLVIGYNNLGSWWIPYLCSTANIVVEDFEIADLNGDGTAEFVAGDLSNYGEGGAIYCSQYPFSRNEFCFRAIVPSIYAQSLDLKDLDGDEDIDIIASSTEAIYWLENLGGDDPEFQVREVAAAVPEKNAVLGADLDGDNDIDIIGRNSRGYLTWFENDGANPPQFTDHAVAASHFPSSCIEAVDLELDGDIDLVVGGELIVWYENNGDDPPTFLQHPLSSTMKTSRIALTDINGDGKSDIAYCDNSTSSLGWFEQTPRANVYHPVLEYDDGPDSIYQSDNPATHLVRFSVPTEFIGPTYQLTQISWYAGSGEIIDPKVVARIGLGDFGLENNCIVQDATSVGANSFNQVDVSQADHRIFVAPGDDFFAGVYGEKMALGKDKHFGSVRLPWGVVPKPSTSMPGAGRHYLLSTGGVQTPEDFHEAIFGTATGFTDAYWTIINFNWCIRATLAGAMSPELGCVQAQPTPITIEDMFNYSLYWGQEAGTLSSGLNETTFSVLNRAGDLKIDQLDLLEWLDAQRQ